MADEKIIFNASQLKLLRDFFKELEPKKGFPWVVEANEDGSTKVSKDAFLEAWESLVAKFLHRNKPLNFELQMEMQRLINKELPCVVCKDAVSLWISLLTNEDRVDSLISKLKVKEHKEQKEAKNVAQTLLEVVKNAAQELLAVKKESEKNDNYHANFVISEFKERQERFTEQEEAKENAAQKLPKAVEEAQKKAPEENDKPCLTFGKKIMLASLVLEGVGGCIAWKYAAPENLDHVLEVYSYVMAGIFILGYLAEYLSLERRVYDVKPLSNQKVSGQETNLNP